MVKEHLQLLQNEIREAKQYSKRQMVEKEQEMKLRYNTLWRLIHMGILTLEDLDGYAVRWGITRTIKREDLPRVRKAVGKVHVIHKEIHTENNKVCQDKIMVTLAVSACPDIKLKYLKELPAWAKCQIQEVVIPAQPERREFALVCDGEK